MGVYKTKRDAKGAVGRYKTKLVVKDYKQKHEIDYDQFGLPNPTVRLSSVRFFRFGLGCPKI